MNRLFTKISTHNLIICKKKNFAKIPTSTSNITPLPPYLSSMPVAVVVTAASAAVVARLQLCHTCRLQLVTAAPPLLPLRPQLWLLSASAPVLMMVMVVMRILVVIGHIVAHFAGKIFLKSGKSGLMMFIAGKKILIHFYRDGSRISAGIGRTGFPCSGVLRENF